jgi:hypothetical protein
MMLSVVAVVVLSAAAVDADQLPPDYQLKVMHPSLGRSDGAGGGVLGRSSNGSALGVDSIKNFSSYFYYPGIAITPFGAQFQFTWPYTIVGRAPFGKDDSDHTTVINAPIVPVIIDLRNADGTPRFCTNPDGSKVRMILDPTKDIGPVLASPVFSNSSYGSSERPTQFTDAIFRAEFFHMSDDDWHTILRPSVKTTRTMVLIRGSYLFRVDSSCNLLFVLVDANVFNAELFPPTPDDTTTVIGQAENAGDVTVRDISTFLFDNTYLYVPDANGNPVQCCTLGYHSYDLEPGDADNGWKERRYVMDYASWISPGLFGPSFVDITALSHELSEAFNDPFVNNFTPFWVAPNGNCQNILETGDVIEGLPNAVYPITMNGMTYHPQNEALLQWFAGVTNSNAIKHAYSYPDTTVLTSFAISYYPDCKTQFNAKGGHP